MLIPGPVWSTPGAIWAINSPRHLRPGMWDWAMCLGVALSIAGALTAANKAGYCCGWDDHRNGDDFAPDL